jgi:hypothetical protein
MLTLRHGQGALLGNTTGTNNIAVGSSAGTYITNGINLNTVTFDSVFLGTNTKALASSQTNQIVIGYNTTGLGSNTAILGNSSITKTQLQGNVGIGTDSPANKLTVSGDIGYTGVIGQGNIYGTPANASFATMQLYNSQNGFSIFNNQSYGYNFRTGGTTRVAISNAGNVGIGTDTPSQKLDVVGNIATAGVVIDGDTTITRVSAGRIAVEGVNVVTTSSEDSLENKTFAVGATFKGSTSGGTYLQASAVAGETTLTLPSATDTLVGTNTNDTLTNKTLHRPLIQNYAVFLGNTSGGTYLQATAVASGLLTLPAATDTLVGRATADTLTNKNLTSPTLTTPILGTPQSGDLANCTIEGNQIITSKPATVGSNQFGPLGMQVARRTITQAEMNALHTTPIVIIGPLGANLVAIPTHCTVFVDTASTNSGIGDLIFGYDSPASYIDSIFYSRRFHNNVATDMHYAIGSFAGRWGTSLTAGVNRYFDVYLSSAASTNCFTSVDIYVTYYVIDRS